MSRLCACGCGMEIEGAGNKKYFCRACCAKVWKANNLEAVRASDAKFRLKARKDPYKARSAPAVAKVQSRSMDVQEAARKSRFTEAERVDALVEYVDASGARRDELRRKFNFDFWERE